MCSRSSPRVAPIARSPRSCSSRRRRRACTCRTFWPSSTSRTAARPARRHGALDSTTRECPRSFPSMSARITIVGGGSYHWAPRLLADFANTPSLSDADVVLHDLDTERMTLMEDLGHEIARRRSIPLKIRSEADRRAAVQGADFVITAFSVGGFDSMQHDIEIPQKYGIRQPIGDSVGPGGIMRALRSVPVLLA